MTSTRLKAGHHIQGTVSYRNARSKVVGAMNIDEMAYTSQGAANGAAVSGIGVFTPKNGKPKVTFALACGSSNIDNTLPCQGGVAQPFSGFGLSLGSVSPITVHVNGNTEKVTFSGAASKFVTAPLGKLSITRPTHATLGFSGTPTVFGSTSASGKAGSFSLFPPRPTGWAVSDSAHHQKFSIAVASDVTRRSVGKVVDTDSNETLATISVDQSGTGKITYADGTSIPVTSWALGE